ncbi:MAG TPA: hypothetical protein VFL62_18760 [Bradyrhizobium sp.]|uniref:hypothetical protein n=1 Tax=Bradyrhizobium sp. TaxID=376 RepID=UPI002D7EF46F|nr:hypothetical protein [Bradyrhizobium sp.]HET7888269.1 hypothetical protein [Bradyrhizobium sp.]
MGGAPKSPEKLFSIGLALLPAFIIFTLFYSVAVKFLERQLTFVQAVYISAVAVAVLIAVVVVFTLAKAPLGLGRDAESFVYLADYLLAGVIITRLAKSYGVEKAGWVGVGARANALILAFGWIVVGVVYLGSYLVKA